MSKEDFGKAVSQTFSQVLQFIVDGFKNMDFKSFFDEFVKLVKAVL